MHLPRRERRWNTRLPSCQVGLLSCLGLETQSPSTDIDAGQSTGPARGDRQTSRFGYNKYQLQLQMGNSNSPALEVLCGKVLGLQPCVLDQADTSTTKPVFDCSHNAVAYQRSVTLDIKPIGMHEQHGGSVCAR